MAQPLAYTLMFLPASERPTADMAGLPVLILQPDNGWQTAGIRRLPAAGAGSYTGICLANGEELLPDEVYIAWALLPEVNELCPSFIPLQLPSPDAVPPSSLPVAGACINSILRLNTAC